MKLPPGKYPPENCHRIFSPMKIPAMKIACKKSPLVKILSVIIALQKMKKQTLKSKIMKVKASDIIILQKSSSVYQNYFR